MKNNIKIPSKVELFKGQTKQLKKDFDALIRKLEATPLCKTDYDKIERDLFEVVQHMKEIVEQL